MTTDTTAAEVWGVAAVLLIVLAICLTFVWALLRAGDKPPQIALLVSLSVLSLLALAIGAALSSESAFAIAAAGVGALAGGVTATFAEGRRQYQQRQEEAPDDGADPRDG